MNKPKISPEFTIEDIHRLREYNYELTKDMKPEDRRALVRAKANAVQERIDKIRSSKGDDRGSSRV